MKITWVCPTYNRSKLLCETTLPLLNKAGIESISLYLSTNELEIYKKEISKYNFDIQIIYVTTEITGIGNIRNLIRDSYGDGTNILMIDDDIKQIMFKPIHLDKLEVLDNIKEFVNNMFIRCEEQNIYMFGVQLHNNPYFMKSEFTTGLSYINGSFTGIRIEHNKEKIRCDINHFEDYLFSILHFIRDKNVLKASNVCLLTKCFNPLGGICQQLGGFKERKKEATTNGSELEYYFPDLVYLKHSKKYDITNIKLKKSKWRDSYIDFWKNYTNRKFLENNIEVDNLEKAVENWNITL